MARQTISLKVPPEWWEMTKRAAEEQGVSATEFVLSAVEDAVTSPRMVRERMARRRVPVSVAPAEPCRHPIGRRLGGNCGVCGKKVA